MTDAVERGRGRRTGRVRGEEEGEEEFLQPEPGSARLRELLSVVLQHLGVDAKIRIVEKADEISAELTRRGPWHRHRQAWSDHRCHRVSGQRHPLSSPGGPQACERRRRGLQRAQEAEHRARGAASGRRGHPPRPGGAAGTYDRGGAEDRPPRAQGLGGGRHRKPWSGAEPRCDHIACAQAPLPVTVGAPPMAGGRAWAEAWE